MTVPEALTQAELQVWTQARRKSAHFHSGAISHDPQKVLSEPRVEIRAKVLQDIISDDDLRKNQPYGAHFYGYRILGRLSLRAVSFRYALTFTGCEFDTPPDFQFAEFAYLALDHCELPGIAARGLRVSASVFLDSSTFSGEVDFSGARIEGDLNASGVRCELSDLRSDVNLGRAAIGGSVFFNGSTIRGGSFHATGIRVNGDLDMTGVEVVSIKRRAVALNAAEIKGNLFLDKGFTAEGDIDLINASVGLTLNLTSCDIRPHSSIEASQKESPSGYDARGTVFADHCHVGGSVFMDDKSHLNGTLHLVGTSIDGALHIDGAVGDGSEAAVFAVNLRVAGVLVISAPTIKGLVTISSSELGSYLKVDEGTNVVVSAGPKMSLHKTEIHGDLDVAELGYGRLDLSGAAIGGRAKVSMGNLGHWLWEATTGHGHQPWRAALLLGVLLLVGVLAFPLDVMHSAVDTPPSYERWTFALDALLPFVDLGQTDAWQPVSRLGVFWYRFSIFAGWLLGVGFAVALSQLFRRP